VLRLKQVKCVDYICENPPVLGPVETNNLDNNSLYEILLSQFEEDKNDLPSEFDISAEDILDARLLVIYDDNFFYELRIELLIHNHLTR